VCRGLDVAESHREAMEIVAADYADGGLVDGFGAHGTTRIRDSGQWVGSRRSTSPTRLPRSAPMESTRSQPAVVFVPEGLEAEFLRAAQGRVVLVLASPATGDLLERLAAFDPTTPCEEIAPVRVASAPAVGVRSDDARAVASAELASAVRYNGLGRYEAAFAAATRACEYQDLGQLDGALAELVEAGIRSGHAAEADAACRRLVARDGGHGPAASGVAACCRALLGDGEVAERLYVEALDLLARTDAAAQSARVHLLYGEWLRRAGRRIEARTHLRAAHSTFTVLGMVGFAERARRELAASSETARKRTADTRYTLTPQEAQIARLARAGRTNPEIGAELFISGRTVEWHLRKVFTKLGVTCRRELDGVLPDVEPISLSA
jgi:DNA-binding CsgD family transcriptional regulator